MPARHIIVTLDGPAGVGKTTLARRVAEKLQIAYLDTGAMFRTLGYTLGTRAETMDHATLEKTLAGCVFSLSGSGKDSVLSVNGVPMGDEIRTEEVGALASQVAQLPAVRTALKKAQQYMGAETSLVVEGRDMGTVVFPQAPYKIFLDASPEERAFRRFTQLQQMGQSPDLNILTEQIRKRDEQDRNRTVAPLRPADDAAKIDTTTLNIDEVFSIIMNYITF